MAIVLSYLAQKGRGYRTQMSGGLAKPTFVFRVFVVATSRKVHPWPRERTIVPDLRLKAGIRHGTAA
jgi:hypothetical protein